MEATPLLNATSRASEIRRSPERARSLPPTLRVAAHARRLLGHRGTRALYASSLATPLRRMLRTASPPGFTLVDVCGRLAGTKMLVDLSCEKYYWFGTHEERVQEAIVSRVSTGAIAYDVGAHVGFFSLLLSETVGPAGRVLAFEPQPANAARLLGNIEANDRANIELHAVALSVTPGVGRMSSHSSSLQGALVESAPADPPADRVAVTSVDALVADGAPPPSFLKIDVEGAEGLVLAGARQTIARHTPAMIIEIHSPVAWGEVLDALPCTYTFIDVEETAYDPKLRMPGHYLAVPVEGWV
jgi:FkbM family methyltransferase